MKRIALVGNPNSGKSTLFNLLTGLNQTIGNWTGVTIEKKEGRYIRNKDVYIIDLPGIYSMSSYSLEERIARDYIINSKPDVIINVVDATNLERNLYLTTQLMETGIDMVIALNMEDELISRGIYINYDKINEILGVTAMPISALKNRNIDKLMNTALNLRRSIYDRVTFNSDIENLVEKLKSKFPSLNRYELIKLAERDREYIDNLTKADKTVLNKLVNNNSNLSEIITNERYAYIDRIIKSVLTRHDNKAERLSAKIDSVLTNKYLAFPIFFAVIFVMYYVSVNWLGSITADFMEELIIVRFGAAAESYLLNAGMSVWMVSLISDGIISGVGMVLTFLPQILLLFTIISFLEGCGYMARVAYIMDRLFKKIGLSGKSFIPMIIGCGCSVPAIMATRTIENNDSRRLTIMLTPFIPCSAKLPVFALFSGVFFPGNPFVAPSMYLLGILAVISMGLLLKKLKIYKTETDTFILEMSSYRLPKLNNILLQLYDKVKSFIIKAGTIILLASVVLWFLQSFNTSLKLCNAKDSLLAAFGRLIAPIFSPLGFDDWRAAVSIISGMIAKEAVISTLSILLEGNTATGLQSIFTPYAAYAFMAFVLLSAPCVAAIGAIRKEMGGIRPMLVTAVFQTLTAYTVSMIIYSIGYMLVNHKGTALTILAGIVIISIVLYSVRKMLSKDKRCIYCSGDCSGCGSKTVK